MQKKILTQLQPILAKIFSQKTNIYKKKYNHASITLKDVTSLTESVFQKLPLITNREYAKAPYKNRSLFEKPGLNKLIFSKSANTYYLTHRSLEEIKKADLPLHGSRPMVLMEDVYEAIETCLFFYEKKILPLIGEILNPAIIYATAQQYDVDSLSLDHACAVLFREELLKRNHSIKTITMIDTVFTSSDFDWPKGIQRNYVISLPEFGRIAYACPNAIEKKTFVFHPFADVFIETTKYTLLTSTRLKACPMIRYKSSLSLKEIPTTCPCKQTSFVYKS